MKRFVHGGDTYGMGEVIDFSASLNPLGMPEGVTSALVEGVQSFAQYPDPLCRKLTTELAEHLGASPCSIVMTAGAGDAFTRLAIALRPSNVLLCDPCYSGYEQALSSAGLADAHVVHNTLSPENDFDLDARSFADALQGIDMAYLCSPNNPTGRAISLDDLRLVLDAAREAHAIVVFDECFAELAGLPTALPLCSVYPNLVIVRAFTKTFALAGLRLGYCVSGDANLVDQLHAAGVPWAVSAPAQVAGLAALRETEYLDRARTLVREQRAYVEQALADLGLHVVPSCGNFILFRGEARLYDALLARGICVRRCASFESLDGSWFRIGLRMPEENAQLVAAIKEAMS